MGNSHIWRTQYTFFDTMELQRIYRENPFVLGECTFLFNRNHWSSLFITIIDIIIQFKWRSFLESSRSSFRYSDWTIFMIAYISDQACCNQGYLHHIIQINQVMHRPYNQVLIQVWKNQQNQEFYYKIGQLLHHQIFQVERLQSFN